jgi:hypothetical protein
MLEKLACKTGRNDEEPNIKLAVFLSDNNDKNGIHEIVEGFHGKDKAVANDCIKVIYEIGARKPELIADYVSDFTVNLLSKNNRIVWGSMTALASIAELKPQEIYEKLDIVMKAYETGSVITIDNSMTVFAKLVKADKKYEKVIFPILISHLLNCRAKEVPQHAERISICIDSDTVNEFIDVLELRKPELSPAQVKRIDKLIKLLRHKVII